MNHRKYFCHAVLFGWVNKEMSDWMKVFADRIKNLQPDCLHLIDVDSSFLFDFM